MPRSTTTSSDLSRITGPGRSRARGLYHVFMPHLKLDMSDGLPEASRLPEILARLAADFSALPTIDPAGLKCYSLTRPHVVMGEGARPGFIHLEVALMDGRSEEMLDQIADAMLATMESLFAESVSAGKAGITVEVRPMLRKHYRKSPSR